MIDLIEVTIKLQTKNLMNYMLIGRSDKVEKLKERCEKLSDIPLDQQNLIYKGQRLLNDKLISYYNIDNGDNIILKKKEEPSPVKMPLAQNFDISSLNNILSNKNIELLKNKEINCNEIANAYKKIPDYFSILQNIDLEKMNNLLKLIGLGNLSENFESKQQEMNLILNNPECRNMMNNIFKDPSLLEIILNHPEAKKSIQNNPFLKFNLLNPQFSLSPQNLQMAQIMLKKEENIKIENSNTEIKLPPGPFDKSQMLNSSGKK